MTSLRLALATLILLGLGACAWAQGQAPAVAVIGIGQDRQSPELQVLQEGLVHMVQSDLATRAGASIVSRQRTALFLDELGLGAAGLAERGTGQRFGSALSADYVALVQLSGDGELTARVAATKVSSGEQVWAASFREPAEKLASLAEEVGGALVNALGLPPARKAAPASGTTPTVAVFDFRSGGSAGPLDSRLSDLTDLLSANLTALDVPLVERQKLSAVLDELGLSASGLARSADMSRVGRLLGAQRLVDTSLIVSGESVVVDCQLLQPETGLVAGSCRVAGRVSELPALMQELALDIAGALRVKITEVQRSNLAQQATGSLEAALHAAAGWRLGRENRAEEAVQELQQAVYLDPEMASAWGWLAEQYESLRDFKKWTASSQRAFAATEGKVDSATMAAMAVQLASSQMWQEHYAEQEAAARLGLSYEPDNYWLHERLIIALVRQGKPKEVSALCESVYRNDKPPYSVTYGVYVAAIHWLGSSLDPSAYNATFTQESLGDDEERNQVLFQLLARALDIFDSGIPYGEDYGLSVAARQSLVQSCGAMVRGNAGIRLDVPLQHGEECLRLARRMTTHTDWLYASARGWFVVGLIEYKLGHGKEAEAALLRCLTYKDVNYDFSSYPGIAPHYGLVYYLLGHTYQDLLKDRKKAIAAYQQAEFWIICDWPAAKDSRAQLAALNASRLHIDWRHTLGTCGPSLTKPYREELISWLPAHGYYMGFQTKPQAVQRREEGVQLLTWEGKLSDVPTADELRAYVAGGGSLLILHCAQATNLFFEPVLSGSATSLDITLDWLLPAFGMGISPRITEVHDSTPLFPRSAPLTVALDEPNYRGRYYAIAAPEVMSLLKLRPPGQSQPDTVAAIARIGLGRVAVVSLQDWIAASNVVDDAVLPWNLQLMKSIMDWLSAPRSADKSPVARHWAAARNLVSIDDYGAAVQEVDKVAIDTPSGPDARYWAGCLLADKVGDVDGAARRWRQAAASSDADPWLVRMAHLRLGIAAVRAGDERTATPELTQAAGEQPDGIWGQAWVAMGDLKLMQADYLRAAQAFRKVADELGHCEERFRALFGLAYAFDKQGKPEAAARVYDAIAVEFGKAPLPGDMDTRWPDPWQTYYPSDRRADAPTVADAVAAARGRL
jgi:tetratricopeptide (TPR) repeat protein